MKVKKAAVIGGGTMGNGITHVFAMNDIPVNLVETETELAQQAVKTIRENLGRMVKKDKLDEADQEQALENITTYTDIKKGVHDVDLVVEAVPEIFQLKKEVFEEIDKSVHDKTVLASNTSSISITKLAAATKNPERFIGMHFFNPVPVMKLVEVVRGLQTSDETFKAVQEAAQHFNKVPVPVKDSPGFVSNRVLMPMINEAIFCVGEGIAEPENIDSVMKLGMSHPMGPLRLADFIGLDVCLDILNVLYEGFKDPKYRPAPLLVKKVEAGKLGNKTGEGFFKYD